MSAIVHTKTNCGQNQFSQGISPGEQFASDNVAGICPEAWEMLEQSRHGLCSSYGADEYTRRARQLIRDFFEKDCDAFFCFTGTAANSMAIAHVCRSYHSVICHEYAHAETDECGGPEFAANGTKLLLARGEYAKIAPSEIERLVLKRSDIHYPRPRLVTLTQSTEFGTVYAPDEIDAISQMCRKHALALHMDGARFFLAVASLNVSPAELTWKRGVNVMCLGGTKLGLPASEAVVFFDHDQAAEFECRCKQAGQLASKMRFLSAPWVGLLEHDGWRRHAQHAIEMTRRLAAGFELYRPRSVLYPVEANVVFVDLPKITAQYLLRGGWHFYNFIGEGHYRFMCSWQTTEAEIAALLADLQRSPR